MMSNNLPNEILASHVAILGKTGSGKTYAAKGLVESLLRDNRRICVVDPTSAWYGLRSSADGKHDGFPILILGGDHGDLPLPALGGAAVARLVAEQNISLIADTSHLTVGERTRWFIEFGSTIFRLNRQPLNLVLDEAQRQAAQGRTPGWIRCDHGEDRRGDRASSIQPGEAHTGRGCGRILRVTPSRHIPVHQGGDSKANRR